MREDTDTEDLTRSEPQPLNERNPCSPCQHSARCAAYHLACQEFVLYIGTNGSSAWKGPQFAEGSRFPTRAIYDKVHVHHPTRAQKAWRRTAGKEQTKGRDAT